MTGTVVQFPPPARMPEAFANVAEALAWYTAMWWRPSLVPPVDATGDEAIDAYTATVFAALLQFPSVTVRLAHLHDKAATQDRHARLLKVEGHPGAEAHERTRDVLRKWADEISDAATAQVGGGAA